MVSPWQVLLEWLECGKEERNVEVSETKQAKVKTYRTSSKMCDDEADI
jgi:hypothetical protein